MLLNLITTGPYLEITLNFCHRNAHALISIEVAAKKT